MAEDKRLHVFALDDEPGVRDAIRRTLESVGHEVSTFGCPEDCLAAMYSRCCDLLITDVVMPGMNGLELLTEVKCAMPSLPVLVVTGYGTVEMAVQAMEAGASTVLRKPLERTSLLAAVEMSLNRNGHGHYHRRDPLTKAEAEVLRLIVHGKGNKEIARLRHRSVRTIEDQRRCIMRKFGVDNPVDLIREVAIVRMPARLSHEQLRLPFDRGQL